ncbi:MAG: hypothetical protein VB141_11570 [Burkholderia gladioli]
MPASYLHGTETIELDIGGRPVQLVKTAVIGLVGTAVAGPVNELTIVSSDRDFVQFGPHTANATIPDGLNAIYDQKTTVVQVINVLDPAKHNSPVTGEPVKLDASGSATLEHPGVVTSLPMAVKNAKGDATYKVEADYVLEPISGRLSRVASGSMPALASLSIDYSYADPFKVTAADLIGGVDEAGRRTGMQQFQTATARSSILPRC